MARGKTVTPKFAGFLLFLVSSMLSAASSGEKIFTYCSEVSPTTFNPQLATDGATYTASAQPIYNRLVGFDADSTKLVPSLAKSWTVSDDGRLVTFQLRDDVYFHDTDFFKPTRKMNSSDVIFTFERMGNKDHPFHKVGGGEYPTFTAQQMGELIERIERVDDYKVRFVLRRPEAPFLANLAMEFASILSAEYGDRLMAEKKMDQLDRLPIGTGPFQFIWFDKDRSIRYKAHPKYFLGRSRVDQLVFLITRDPKKRFEHILQNECQLMPDPLPEMLPEIRKHPELKLWQQPGLNIAYLTLAIHKVPFQDINVRKAIHHALNRSAYIKKVYGGHAQVAKNPIPPGMWSYNRSIQDLEYNVTKAREYLKMSSVPTGFATELWYSGVSRPYNPNSKKMAELVKADLEVIGIKVKLVEMDWDHFLARTNLGEQPMSLQGWSGDNGDPDNFLNTLLSCLSSNWKTNGIQWCDKKFSFLIDRARVTTNIRKRTEFYEQAQKLFKEQLPWVTLAHATEFKVVRRNIIGFKPNAIGVVDFHGVDFK